MDNTIFVQEVIHSRKNKKVKGMAIMLEMVNSFDKVRHSFLLVVLKKFFFDDKFISWIENCIMNPRKKILNPKVLKEEFVEWLLGQTHPIQEKPCRLYQGLLQVLSLKFTKLTVIGDSSLLLYYLQKFPSMII